ncbi:MAG TPA: hypothetical protein ENK68_03530 [Epsilonproteobacteria bacterium]|nr:hypothetical protein [Campylobacterota bacterium]
MKNLFKPTLTLLLVTLLSYGAEVSTISPKKEACTIRLHATGVVEPKNSTAIGVQTKGVLHFLVANNTRVSKGQLIARVVDRPREKSLKLLSCTLNSLKNQIKLEEQKLDTEQDKLKMGVGTKNSYLNQKILLVQAKERYEMVKNEYDLLLLEEKNAKIYAPSEGLLTNLSANNTYVNYGASIATLLDAQTIVKLFVDASSVKAIQKGMPVALKSSYTNCEAMIVSVLPKSSGNLIEVIAESREKLPLDLQLDAEIVLKQSTALLIPKEAIVLEGNHPAVYVVDEKNIAHLTFVSIEKEMQTKVLIKETLPKEAKVVLKNAYMLHDNIEVSIK